MAGDWIKFRSSLPKEPKVVRISSALKADRLRTVGGLASAWCLFDELTEDGILDGYTPELFDSLVGLPGLTKAMESVGWMVVGDDFLQIPRFFEHNGKSAKRRAQDRIRKLSAREADKCPHDERTESGLEKRREEKRRDTKEKKESEAIFAFDSDRFREAWDRWERHRIEQHKPLGEIEAEQQQMKLARFSEEEAIEVIEFSIQVGAKNLVLNGDHKAKRPKDDGSDKRFW